jgi:hypothetical protein
MTDPIETKTFFKPDTKLNDGVVASGRSKTVEIYGEDRDYMTYVSKDMEMEVREDGTLYLFDHERSDYSIWIYPEQLPHLQHMLEIALKQAGKNV